jgi:K+-sensing histidine kinase KdpD
VTAGVSWYARTPLNAIFGWARVLERSELDARSRKRAVTAIVNGASVQARLVDDLGFDLTSPIHVQELPFGQGFLLTQ